MTTDARIRSAAVIVLSFVAASGAILSYASLYRAALPIFGPILATLFPLLVDALVLGASLMYRVTGRFAWRATAHLGVASTIWLNALAGWQSGGWVSVPWHIAAPITWSLLVELWASRDLSESARSHSHIPLKLWLAAPLESASTALRIARQSAHTEARLDVGHNAAALAALKLALPGRSSRKVRKILRRQLRAGSLSAAAVLDRSVTLMRDVPETDVRGVLRDVLATTLSPSGQTRPEVRTGPTALRNGQTHALPESVPDSPAPELTGLSKREAVRFAHRESGLSSTPDIMRWLASRGVVVSKSDAYAVAREVSDSQTEDTRPILAAVNDN